jgi:hypothetical protein
MNNTEIVKRGLKKRYAREKRFQWYGRGAVMVGFIFLALLIVDITIKALPAFSVTEIQLAVALDRESLGLPNSGAIDADMISAIDFGAVIKRALRDAFPEVSSRKDKKLLYQLVSSGAEFPLSDMLQANPGLVGQKSQTVWLKADDDIDTYYKLGTHTSRVDDRQVEMIEQLRQNDRIRVAFNTTFFSASDSREPEQAGIRGAIAGSFWTLLVTLLVSLPVGVAAAIYLEEFDRNQYQQSCGGTIDCLRYARSSGIYQLFRHAALGANSRWTGVVADDAADDHHLQSRGAEIGAAIDQGSRARYRCLQDAGRISPYTAAGHARNSDRFHYRHGTGARRIGAAADDRHGRIYRRCARRDFRFGNRAAGTDLPVV